MSLHMYEFRGQLFGVSSTLESSNFTQASRLLPTEPSH